MDEETRNRIQMLIDKCNRLENVLREKDKMLKQINERIAALERATSNFEEELF